MNKRLMLAAVALATLAPIADARAADPATHAIAPSLTDPAIIDTTPTRGNNLVWLGAPERRVGKLLVFLPLGGMANIPTEFEEFGSEAGRLGYHTIVLAYRNEAPVAMAPPVGCGNAVDPPTPPDNCAINARMEILDGSVNSTTVNVEEAGTIKNRLNKLLAHLAATYPGEGWAQFLVGTEPKWSDTVIAGGSFGAGQAAIIAAQHSVHRAVLMTGWTDAKHGWITLGATPTARYATLIHQREEFFARTCFAYLALGLTAGCPLQGFTIPPTPVDPANPLFVENRPLPFGTSQLVFNIEPINQPPINNPYHPSPLRDGYLAREADGTVSRTLVSAWRSVLGDSDADGFLDEADNCPQLASPDQTDPDQDTIGTPCDSTPRGTTPPVITVTGATVDATSPAGALVAYTAAATDDLDGTPPVTCTPAAGTRFAIGNTTVACSAADAGNNTANASFTVNVRGAPEQLGRLVTKLGGSPALAALFASFDPNRPLQRLAVCVTLRAFIVLAPFVAPTHAAGWIVDANRIRAVLAC